MKNLFISLLLLCMTSSLCAQQTILVPSLKYGKPTNEELTMTTYAPDTSAVAVVLYKTCDVRYEYMSNGFRLNYEHEVKIKVLKSEGTTYADVSIPYYEPESGNGTMKVVVIGLDASAYNMEGGKMVREKMKKEFVFKERLSKQYMQMKFSIPNVKVGTVLEYKYKILSDYFTDISGWTAQQDIPVVYGHYDIAIPEYFKFNLDTRRNDLLSTTEKPESLSFTIMGGGQSDMVQCTGRRLTFKVNQLPSLHADSFLWCPDDYRAQVSFELQGFEFPGALYKNFTQTWDQIDKMLLDDSDFGGALKMRNPYRDEMAALGIDKLPDANSKISALFLFLQKKMNWNQQYALYGNEVKKAIKNGTGNNADFNFVLMSMLRDANIHCAPVVMSRRSQGILPFAHPSIQKLNTFIIAAANSDSTFVYLDGSIRTGYLNLLPTGLMVTRARMIDSSGSQWVNLSNLGKNQLRSLVNVSIDAEGKITGTRKTAYYGQYASSIRNSFRKAKDSIEFVNNLETEESIKVTDISFNQMNHFSPQVEENITFEKQATVNDNFIYLNPMVFLHVEKSPFTQAERKLPVELPFTEQMTLAIKIDIPEGYAVDEIPKAQTLKTEDGSGKCRYNIQVQGNQLSLTYTFSYDKLSYTIQEYPGLKMFWEAIVEKNNEMLVLKKI